MVIGCNRIETISFNNFFLLVQYYFNSITVFLGPRDPLPGGGGLEGESMNPENRETQHPNIYFWYFENSGIRNCPYILLIYSLVQNSANLFFFFNSDISGLLQCRIETSNGAFFSTLRGPPLIHIGTLCIFRSMCKISSFL